MKWGRLVVLEVQPPDGGEVRRYSSVDGPDGVGFRIGFDVRRSATSDDDTGRVTIYGVGDATTRALQRDGARIRLLAGHNGAPVEVIAGRVLRGSYRESREGRDRVVSVAVSDGGIDLRSRTYARAWATTTASAVLDEVLTATGTPRGVVRLARDPVYATGYAYAGTVAEWLDDLARDTGSSVVVQGGKVHVYPAGGQRETRAVLVSEDTGLIGQPRRMDKGRIEVRTILEPAVRPGDLIRCESRTWSGDLVVEDAQQVGDAHEGSEYDTIVTGRPLARDEVVPATTTTPQTSRASLARVARAHAEAAAGRVRGPVTAVVESYDATTKTVTVRPVVAEVRRTPGAEPTYVEPVPIPGVAIVWPAAGGVSLTWAPSVGDYGLLVPQDRSHDEVDAGAVPDGQAVRPASSRRHSYADAKWIPGAVRPGDLAANAVRTDGEPVLRLPSGDALHVGGNGASMALAVAAWVHTQIDEIRNKFEAHTHSVTGTCPTGGGPLSGGVASATVSTITTYDVGSGRVVTDDSSGPTPR